MRSYVRSILLVAVGGGILADTTGAAANDLPARLSTLLSPLQAGGDRLELHAEIRVGADDKAVVVTGRFVRWDAQCFDLVLHHQDYAAEVYRRADQTAFVLPRHQRAFVGAGPAAAVGTPGAAADSLMPDGAFDRLVSPDTALYAWLQPARQADPKLLGTLLTALVPLQPDPAVENRWRVGKDVLVEFPSAEQLVVSTATLRVALTVKQADAGTNAGPIPLPAGVETRAVPRADLEVRLARGVRRALEILMPGTALTAPATVDAAVPHGKLRWIDGHRVVLLAGTPEEVGRAHGELLQREAQKCIDSVLYTFGTAQTIRTGRWFDEDLRDAYRRLAPHIPEHHQRETAALAHALHLEPTLLQTLNVFPELFHCSGFAVAGSATKDGKLYHGRVLDYMTTIGLQDAATTFVVAVEGKIPFVNVGYAGFIGSVSGMNLEKVSLGEMGGRGEGQWDGVPMATLMRRALEECRTLDDVVDLWRRSPRTCEYYYVFADGKSNRAVGVAATPEQIEFVQPGQGHARLGEGIPDTVVLSAGSRLETLRARVQQQFGRIDTQAALALMARPVAMQSNLHNVLFIPEDGVLYVANANHREPAADRPYVRLDFAGLLRDLQASR